MAQADNGGVGARGGAVAGGDPGTVGGTTGGTAGGTTGGATGGPVGGTTGGTAGGTTGGATGGPVGGTTGGATGGATGGGTQGAGDNDASGGGEAAGCDGFQNQTGITDDWITIGNVSDISGAIPGLFEQSQTAVNAYVAYFNSGSDICGRKLAVKTYDSRVDAGADQQGYTAACEETFATVGSMSAFDSGGAATAQGCGLPDIRSAAVTGERSRCATCFGAQSTNSGQFQNAVPDYVLKNYGSAGQHAAMFYLNIGAAPENGKNQAAAMEKRGMNFDYIQGIETSEFNYAPYVQQMKDKGIEYVQFIGGYRDQVRLAQAMQQQGFKPKIFMLDPTAYNPNYVETGGSAVEGTVLFMNFVPFEEANNNAELQLYLSWLEQVKPGAEPGFFGLFSWSAARLFVERATALGGKLSRSTLVNEFKGVSGWTSNGLHSPQMVGSKDSGQCWRFVQLQGGKWVPVGGTKYSCSGLTSLS